MESNSLHARARIDQMLNIITYDIYAVKVPCRLIKACYRYGMHNAHVRTWIRDDVNGSWVYSGQD